MIASLRSCPRHAYRLCVLHYSLRRHGIHHIAARPEVAIHELAASRAVGSHRFHVVHATCERQRSLNTGSCLRLSFLKQTAVQPKLIAQRRGEIAAASRTVRHCDERLACQRRSSERSLQRCGTCRSIVVGIRTGGIYTRKLISVRYGGQRSNSSVSEIHLAYLRTLMRIVRRHRPEHTSRRIIERGTLRILHRLACLTNLGQLTSVLVHAVEHAVDADAVKPSVLRSCQSYKLLLKVGYLRRESCDGVKRTEEVAVSGGTLTETSIHTVRSGIIGKVGSHARIGVKMAFLNESPPCIHVVHAETDSTVIVVRRIVHHVIATVYVYAATESRQIVVQLHTLHLRGIVGRERIDAERRLAAHIFPTMSKDHTAIYGRLRLREGRTASRCYGKCQKQRFLHHAFLFIDITFLPKP